jgi:arylsulfatase A-like enzyme
VNRVGARHRRTLLALATVSALVGCGGAPPAPPPDLWLVSLDTLRADRLSCYGNPRPTTPFLDSLAERGLRFAHAYSPSPHTAPSHMSLFTGLDPLAHGVPNTTPDDPRVLVLSPQIPTLAERFREAGYHTLAISDRGQLNPAAGFGRGFDGQYFEYSNFERKLEVTLDLLAELPDDGAPLFAFFHSYQCHAPYLPPAEYYERFVEPGYDGELRRRYEELRARPGGASTAQAGTFLARFPGLGPADAAWLLSLYDANLAYADAMVAELFRRVAAHRPAERTLVALVSDHGEGFLEHGFLGHPPRLERELLAIPLLLAGPGVPRGVVETPVPLTGLFATLLTCAGLPVPDHAEPGFAAVLRDPRAALPPRELHAQLVGLPLGQRSEAVALGDRRFLRDHTRSERLYAFPGDPWEQSPLEAAEAELEPFRRAIQRRRQVAGQHLQRFPSLVRQGADARQRAELEALGYAQTEGGQGH